MRVGIGIILSVLSSSVLAAVIPNDDDHGILLARRTGSLENKDLLWKRADEEQMELGSSNSGAGASTEASAGASAGDDAEASTSTGENSPNNSRGKTLTKVTEGDDKSGFISEVETLLRTALNEARGFMKAFKKVKKPFVLFTPEGKNRKQSARRSCVEELREERRLSARFVAFNCLCFLQNSQGRVAWLKQADLVSEISIAELDARSVFLGLDEQVGLPYWAVDVTNCQSLISKLETQLCLGKFVEARPAAFDLPRFEASIVGQARSLIDWNARYIYCPSCGSKTKQAESGHKRLCLDQKCISHSSVQNYSHPRTDAAVIIAVSSVDGNRILLGRQKDWPERVYSCIAGFLECGESIDEACKREVNEETNVQVGSVLFHSSQPWPFPSQLMLGCFGQAVSDEIKLKDGELQDARWFH
ncbi:hypothetical protein BASA62_004035 [Batrachochytrium salamandrivorans]|nr:hypothetical protein BASA62_004035 [Batrachochytrium salamandrivorans]